ncbi:MAG: hypothetical protein WAT46_13275, partial [Saprospiraceae bacterium]
MIYKFLNIGIIMCFNLTCINVFSQSERHSLNVYTGYSIGQPDKRYDFLYGKLPLGPVQTVINKSGRTTPDDEYSVGLSYRYNLRDRVKLGFGIGYAILIQDFLLPADGNGYFMQSIKPFFWRDKSHYHMIQ